MKKVSKKEIWIRIDKNGTISYEEDVKKEEIIDDPDCGCGKGKLIKEGDN